MLSPYEPPPRRPAGNTVAKIHSHEAKRKRAFGAQVQHLRKVNKLSRRELEEISGVPGRSIIDIENGLKTTLDRKTVYMLAYSFQLTCAQERVFVAAAGLLPDVELSCPDFYDIVRNFYSKTDCPAFMMDNLFDLHSCNAYMLALFGVPMQRLYAHAYTGAGPNILRFLFDPFFGARAAWGDQWQSMACLNVHLFREFSEPHVHEPRYTQLLRELHKLPDFTSAWQATEAMGEPPLPPYTSTLHSAFGAARIMHLEMASNEAISQHLHAALYMPLDDAETHATFAKLRAQVMKSALQFGSCEIARFTRIL